MSQYPYRIQRFDADSLGGLPASDYLTVDGTIAADQIIGLGTGGGVGGTQAEYAVSAGTARYALNAGSLGGVAASGYLTAGGTIASSQVFGLSDSLASALGTVATSRLVGAIDADSLNGELPSYYLDLANSTGTLSGDRLYGIPYERLLDAPTGGSGTVDAGNVYGNLDNASIPVSNVSGSIDADAVGGATASQLRDRSTHTGTQPASSIGDLNLILNTLEVGYALNAGSLGGVPASGYLTVGGTIASSQVPGLDDSILSALGTIASSRLVGAIDADSLDGELPAYYLALENSTGTLAGDRLYGIPYERLTGAPSGTVVASDVYGSLGNASVPASNITGSVDAASVGGATASQLRDRSTHTGTQPASSIGDLNSILDTIRGGTASDALLLGGNPPSFYQPASGTIAGDRLTGNAPSITIDASQVANLGTGGGGGGTQADYALNAGSLGGNPPSFYLPAVAAGTVADIDAARISGTGSSLFIPSANILNPANTGRRQAIINATTDINRGVGTLGIASFISAGSGLSVNVLGASVPIILNFANGFDVYGAIDELGIISSDVVVGSLAASRTNFIYAEFGSGGQTSVSATTLAPIYGYSFPGSPSENQLFFHINNMKMYRYESTSWIPKNIVFLGEAVTNSSVVTSAISYALNGSRNVLITKNNDARLQIYAIGFHNIGVTPRRHALYLLCIGASNGYSVGDIIYRDVHLAADNANLWADRNNVGLVTDTKEMHWRIQPKTFFTASGIYTIDASENLNWETWVYLDRGW